MVSQRVHPQQGYDLWADAYDAWPNPVVRLDERVTPGLVQPRPGERVLDAGCGTGRAFATLLAGSDDLVGFDFSPGMLRVAHRKYPDVPLVLGDLQQPWPFRADAFDVVLCALVGEHLTDLRVVFAEMNRVLVPGGRMVFSVYHPAMAEAGKEANFQRDNVEYRLGAERHSLAAYLKAAEDAGFRDLMVQEFAGDEELANEIPAGRKFVGFPMLVVIRAATPEPEPFSLEDRPG